MKATELNMLITGITNHLYCELDEKDFLSLGLFLSMLSKSMLSMETLRKITRSEEKHELKPSRGPAKLTGEKGKREGKSEKDEKTKRDDGAQTRTGRFS